LTHPARRTTGQASTQYAPSTFQPSVQAKPSLVDKVTADDIELAKRPGMDLSFVTLKDTE